MDVFRRLVWLRRVLLAKILITFFLWGLPALLAPAPVFNLLGMKMPADPTYLRLLGAAVTAIGVAYWFAFQNPIRNVDIVKFGVVDNVLATITIVIVGLTRGASWLLWATALATGLFAVLFYVLMPREVDTAEYLEMRWVHSP